MDHQGPDPLTVVDCCLTLGDVIQSPNSSGGSCGGIVGEIYNKPPDTTLLLVRNCVSLGNLILRDPAGRAHPITAHADGVIFDNNIYDQRLSVQGEGIPQEQVARGCTARPSTELLAELPERDNRYIIGSDGALTIRNLEIGGGICEPRKKGLPLSIGAFKKSSGRNSVAPFSWPPVRCWRLRLSPP